ncbi:hypothetical protein Tco_1134600 [Tanacetum coccineum]
MGCNDDVIVANIYAPQDLASKKALWENLLTTLDMTSGLWVETHDFGPHPFKFFNSWLDIPSLEVTVKNVWSTSLFDPRLNVVFWSKLKALKLSIKSWRKMEDEKNASTFNNIINQMANFDKVAEEKELT